MWKNLSYKRKTKAVFWAGVLMLLLSWQFAIKNTMVLRDKVRSLEVSFLQEAITPEQISILKTRLQEAELLMGSTATGEKSQRQQLLDHLSAYCKSNKILLKSLPEIISKTQGEYQVETNVFTLEGPFIPLLKLQYDLEKKKSTGRLASSHYLVRTDPKTKKDILTATIYIHNLSPIAQ